MLGNDQYGAVNRGALPPRSNSEPLSEQRLAIGGANTSAPARRVRRCTGLDRGRDGCSGKLRGLRVYPLTATASQCLTGHYGHSSWKSSSPTARPSPSRSTDWTHEAVGELAERLEGIDAEELPAELTAAGA